MKRASILLAAGMILSVLACGGCKPAEGPIVEGMAGDKNYDRSLGEGQFAMRKLSLSEYPDFSSAFANTADLREAVLRSLDYLSKGSSKTVYTASGFGLSPNERLTHERQVATLNYILKMLDGGLNYSQLNAELHEKFDVWTSIGCDDQGTVLFTGYYTPIFDASPVRTDRFRFPLYKVPADLDRGPDGLIRGRKTAGGTAPYPTREEIEKSNLLAGTEAVWLGDPFEAYIVQVQGSGRLRMPDGTLVTYGYAGSNGQQYNSVGKLLVAEGKLDKSQLSLRGMIDYFRAHPQDVQAYTWKNPRYVFFQALTDASPRGSLNEPVTKLRTVATDKSIFPRASLTFISTKLPARTMSGIEAWPYTGLLLDQDTGNAIRAPGRCDVYMGVGDEAGELAGRTFQEGRLYYIFLKTQYVASVPAAAPAAPAAPAAVPG
jgi:membrane-bound lytic murein transglycosylase A